ncbi:plasmalemma vesicle-associated protein isoform X1 [Anolis sagrei]|uniref:plasmalemma vesicle-associated protein isoform X1 n=1 Tax=Anolis sagrei TaxID=38937 RepID=UPI003522A4DB
MDGKNPYTMAKLGLDARDPQEKTERDCGFYAKYFFLFLSLIQFLIILGLVLFMVYGSPQAGNEKQIQGLSSLLQRAESKAEALGKEVADLKRRLNASQTETAQIRKLATGFNITLRSCISEKTKLAEQQRTSMMCIQFWQECNYNLHMMNTTWPTKVALLEDQLKVLQLQAQLDRENAAAERHRLQAMVDKAEKDAKDCLVEKLKVQTREEKYRELESKVMIELRPVQQILEEAVRRSLVPEHFRNCYVCQDLSSSLQSQIATLARQVDQKVAEVAAQNGRLESQKEACGHELQGKERQAAAQRQQAEQEKQALRDAHAQAALKAEAERSRLAKEKEELQAQLDHSKQACLRSRLSPMNPGLGPGRFPSSAGSTNPFASFPGGSPPNLNPGGAPMVPNTFGNLPPWARPGQPASGSQGSPNHPERPRLPEPKMSPEAAARIPNQPPIGHPSG